MYLNLVKAADLVSLRNMVLRYWNMATKKTVCYLSLVQMTTYICLPTLEQFKYMTVYSVTHAYRGWGLSRNLSHWMHLEPSKSDELSGDSGFFIELHDTLYCEDSRKNYCFFCLLFNIVLWVKTTCLDMEWGSPEVLSWLLKNSHCCLKNNTMRLFLLPWKYLSWRMLKPFSRWCCDIHLIANSMIQMSTVRSQWWTETKDGILAVTSTPSFLTGLLTRCH